MFEPARENTRTSVEPSAKQMKNRSGTAAGRCPATAFFQELAGEVIATYYAPHSMGGDRFSGPIRPQSSAIHQSRNVPDSFLKRPPFLSPTVTSPDDSESASGRVRGSERASLTLQMTPIFSFGRTAAYISTEAPTRSLPLSTAGPSRRRVAQRLRSETYESPALPLSYSATAYVPGSKGLIERARYEDIDDGDSRKAPQRYAGRTPEEESAWIVRQHVTRTRISTGSASRS